MKQLTLLIGTLCLSINSFADSTLPELSAGVLNATQNHSAKPAYIVYGGQDISRSRVAVEDTTLWTGGERTLVG